MYPDFIGIGAQKAGTTWLVRNLLRHPQIYMPRKEIHYFDEKINEPPNLLPRLHGKLFGKHLADRRWRRQVKNRIAQHLKSISKEDLVWDLRYYVGTPGDRWYASLFESGKGKVIGEITPAYSILEPEVIALIHERMPGAKILFLMRNPVERAWSQAVMLFEKTSRGDVNTATETQLRRTFEREGSRSRANYLRTLENWGSFYPEDQIFVGFLEDIHFFPRELLGRILEFLGVDPSFVPPGLDEKRHSRSGGTMPTNAAVYLARTYREEISRLSERFGGYASFWLYCAERLVESPPEEDAVSYPLWESAMWTEWTGEADAGSQRPQIQSGILSAVHAG